MALKECDKAILDKVARAQKRSVNCLLSEAVVRDWGCPGCSRPVVIVTFVWRAEHEYMGEFDTGQEARKFAGLCNRRLGQAFDAA